MERKILINRNCVCGSDEINILINNFAYCRQCGMAYVVGENVTKPIGEIVQQRHEVIYDKSKHTR